MRWGGVRWGGVGMMEQHSKKHKNDSQSKHHPRHEQILLLKMRTTTRTFSAPLALTSHPTPPHTARGLHCGLQSNPENNSVQVTRNLSAQETQNSSVQPAQNSSVQPTSTDTELKCTTDSSPGYYLS